MRLRASVQLGCFVGAARSSVVEMLLIGILGGVRITLHPQRNATTVRSTAAVLLQDNPTVLQCSDPMCARAPACLHACAHTHTRRTGADCRRLRFAGPAAGRHRCDADWYAFTNEYRSQRYIHECAHCSAHCVLTQPCKSTRRAIWAPITSQSCRDHRSMLSDCDRVCRGDAHRDRACSHRTTAAAAPQAGWSVRSLGGSSTRSPLGRWSVVLVSCCIIRMTVRGLCERIVTPTDCDRLIACTFTNAIDRDHRPPCGVALRRHQGGTA